MGETPKTAMAPQDRTFRYSLLTFSNYYFQRRATYQEHKYLYIHVKEDDA